MPRISVFDNRNEYTEEEQEAFDGGYWVRFTIAPSVYITVVNNKHGNGQRLFYLEIPAKSTYERVGLRNGQKLWLDDSTPWLRAAQRIYRRFNKPGNYSWWGEKINGAMNAWRNDRVVWLAINVIEAALPEELRCRLEPWVYSQYAIPHCPLSLESEDFIGQGIYAPGPEE